jgi:hypothetical protein
MNGELFMLDMKQILTIRKSFWENLGDKISNWIIDDSDNGILQNGVHHYVSATYKKYKANYMKRFTNKKGKKLKIKSQTVEFTKYGTMGRYNQTSGNKLAAVKGQSVVSNRTSSVDMKLTGRTLKGLHVAGTTDDSVTMSYRSKDSDKIAGNEEKYNRVIAGLNEKNIKKALDEYSKELDKNIAAWAKKDILIYVGRR